MSDAHFEVLEAEDDVEARRLCTVEAVQAIMNDPPADAVIERHIDDVSAQLSRLAALAGDAPTFAEEDCRATWYATNRYRGQDLLLPWRLPVTAVTLVTEGETELEEGVDYIVEAGCSLMRLCNDRPSSWSTGKIVVEFTAGFDLPDAAPADLAAAAAQQVRHLAMQVDKDSTVRSETVPDVYSATYAFAGGDSVGSSGLLRNVESTVDQYRPVRV